MFKDSPWECFLSFSACFLWLVVIVFLAAGIYAYFSIMLFFTILFNALDQIFYDTVRPYLYNKKTFEEMKKIFEDIQNE